MAVGRSLVASSRVPDNPPALENYDQPRAAFVRCRCRRYGLNDLAITAEYSSGGLGAFHASLSCYTILGVRLRIDVDGFADGAGCGSTAFCVGHPIQSLATFCAAV